MALFSSNRYFKPGKGVERDEPQKKAFFRFFELYFRKFWKYILINLIYVAVLLPFILYLYATVYDMLYYLFMAMGFTPEQIENVWTPFLYLATLYYNYLPAPVTNVLLVLSVLAYGPCRAGMTYVLRNFACEQHAWISDIWDKAKENWKQGMLFGVLDMLVLFVAVFNLSYRPESIGGGMASLLTASKYLTVLAVLLYSYMRKYIFLMIVTVKLKATAIVKNAWLLMMIGIFRNVGSGLLNALLWLGGYALVLLVHPMFEALLLPFLLPVCTNLINIFASYPLIRKYMVEPIEQMSPQEREALMQPSSKKLEKQARKARKAREKDQYYNS